MKKLTIRFIEHEDTFLIQRKTIFGWRYIRYEVGSCYGGSVTYQYQHKVKEDLLEEVLDRHYNTCKKYVRVTEYPTIKKY